MCEHDRDAAQFGRGGKLREVHQAKRFSSEMKTRAQRSLRLSCLTYCVLVAVTHVLAGAEVQMLPDALQVWQAANPLPDFYFVGGSLAVLGTLVGSGGLLMRKEWAAYVHLASTVLWIAFGCAAGPVVSAGLTSPLVSAIFVLAGLIYGLAFFTDALTGSEE